MKLKTIESLQSAKKKKKKKESWPNLKTEKFRLKDAIDKK
jgi:hypothetical protein